MARRINGVVTATAVTAIWLILAPNGASAEIDEGTRAACLTLAENTAVWKDVNAMYHVTQRSYDERLRAAGLALLKAQHETPGRVLPAIRRIVDICLLIYDEEVARVRARTQGAAEQSLDRLTESLRRVREASGASGAAPVAPPKPPRSPQEADREMNRVIKGAARPDACTKKQYGAGWVVVCDDPGR